MGKGKKTEIRNRFKTKINSFQGTYQPSPKGASGRLFAGLCDGHRIQRKYNTKTNVEISIGLDVLRKAERAQEASAQKQRLNPAPDGD